MKSRYCEYTLAHGSYDAGLLRSDPPLNGHRSPSLNGRCADQLAHDAWLDRLPAEHMLRIRRGEHIPETEWQQWIKEYRRYE